MSEKLHGKVNDEGFDGHAKRQGSAISVKGTQSKFDADSVLGGRTAENDFAGDSRESLRQSSVSITADKISTIPTFDGWNFSHVSSNATSQLVIQPKLMVGPADDLYEQEADRIAKQVMDIPAPVNGLDDNEPVPVKREDDYGLARMKPQLRRRGTDGFETDNLFEANLNRQRGRGFPMPGALRDFFEPRFGADFSGVRLHNNEQSHRLNEAIQAEAFTTGQDIFFRRGNYAPGSQNGKELIAHELTHVVQQNGTGQHSTNPIIQRKLVNKKKQPASIKEFQAEIIGLQKNNHRNPYNLNPLPGLTNYLFTYYDIIIGAEVLVDITQAARAYWDALTAAVDQLNVDKSALKILETESKKQKNTEDLKDLTGKPPEGYIKIFRGTSPVQATQILINKTMGGSASAGIDLQSPGEEAAKKQTGENVKETEGGRIEEWSEVEGGLQGFSTDGVMLIAWVNATSVARAKAKIGERGVTGYANQPLLKVAIYNFGEASFASPEDILFQKAKEAFHKRIGAADKTQARPTVGKKPVDPGNYDPSNKFFE